MNILFVTHHYLTGYGGGTYASKAFINAFSDLSSHLTLLFPVKSITEVPKEINSKAVLIPVAYNKPKWAKLFDLLCGSVHRFDTIFRSTIKLGSYDVVIFDTSIVSWKLIDVAHQNNSKVITIHHNFQYEYFRDNASSILKIPTLFWCKKYEKEAVLKSDMNLTLTYPDKILLSEHYDKKQKSIIEVIGMFQYKKIPLSTASLHKTGNVFCITGSLSDAQTAQSIIYWLKNYYPILQEIVPESELIISGKKPGEMLIEFCREYGIHLIASPPDMNEVISKAQYYICPVFLGGGIKLRIMDGLKCGLKVLTHKVSARGYEAFKDICLFEYDDENTFRKSLIAMIEKPIGNNEIMSMYQRYFGYESGKERIRKVLEVYFAFR